MTNTDQLMALADEMQAKGKIFGGELFEFAESWSARLRALAAQPEGEHLPAELCNWMRDRDILPDADENGAVEMSAVIEALTEHERECLSTPQPERPQGGVVAEVAAWHRRMHRELSGKGSAWASAEMYRCQHGKFADALERLATPPSAPAVGEVWHSVSDELPAVTGWYIGFWMGRVEPLQWRGEYWHHTRPTRDIATPSHWMQMPTPPTTPQPGGREVGKWPNIGDPQNPPEVP
jgi:hypothetical protein